MSTPAPEFTAGQAVACQSASPPRAHRISTSLARSSPRRRGPQEAQKILELWSTDHREGFDLYLDEADRLLHNDFDVLAQLAVAGGELRMSELSARSFSSRSGMTRRVARLVDEGLVTRTNDEADARERPLFFCQVEALETAIFGQ